MLNKTNTNKGESIMNTELMQVAETIRSQIHPTVLMCAAARNYGAIKNKDGLYGIQFKISNTSKYKFATVRIVLNGADLYDIEIKNIRGRIVDSKTDIYCDQLSEVLEGMWENKKTLKIWSTKLKNKYSEKEERA
jgi:hypothetical protein|tara:strand:+ start:438 stop:842 length:405 start_codon:yes stop_codon:yes gene_type:complete